MKKGTDEYVIDRIHTAIRKVDRDRKALETKWLETRGTDLREEVLKCEGRIAGLKVALAFVEEKRNENLFPF